MKKRLLAMMMAIVMVMTLLPTSALAAAGDTDLQEGQVRATKALVLDDNNQPKVDPDGYYTVQITVQGKPKQAENGSNADVVLVVDNSGSMGSSVGDPCNTPKDDFNKENKVLWYSYTCPNCGAKYTSSLAGLLWDERPEQCTGQTGKITRINAAKAVSKEFANSILAAETGNQLAVIGFAHNKDRGGVDEKALTVFQDLTTDKNLIDTQIDQMEADGGTNYTAALAQAQKYLNNRTDKTRPGYVIFISDGAPGLSGDSLNDSKWNGSEQIKQLKTAGITVYTVGIALEADAEDYLKSMASDKQDEHFINVSTTKYKDEMSKILQTWATKINSIPAGTNATITDVVNTDDFDYEMVGTPSNVTNVNGTITWDIGKITEEPQSIKFKVKPKNGKDGKLYTNNSVTLSYTNCEGQNLQIQDTKTTEKPQIGNPYIEIANPAVVTITFDANGGEWTEAVTGYEMGADNKTASKKFNLSDTVEKITPDPVQDGKKFSGRGVKLDKDEIVAYPLLETSATAAAHKRIFDKKPIIFYAMWDDAAQPTEKLNYTTRQHYIDEKGNEVGTVDVGGGDLLALQGTKISKLIQHLENNQNYFGQNYFYDRTKTTVNGVVYADTMTLDTKGTAIDLYYYLDAWNDKDDTLTGGDGIPDKYQALVKFESADATKGAVAGEGAVQVFTFKDTDGKYLTSGNVTPSLDNVTTTPADGFAFDYWTKDGEKADPSQLIPNVNGGTTIIFKANWKSNVVTITFDANGGAWAADANVADYKLKDNNTKASKKFNLSDTVEKITSDPVQDGKKFSGWGVKLDKDGNLSDKIVAYPLVETSATAAAHKRIFGEHPIIFYAMWEDAAQPTEKLNYTIHQHYIGSNGKQDAQFNDELPKTASAGTKISDLIPAELQKDRKYYYQTYIYLSSETKIVNDNVATPVADDTVLNKDNTQIHLYYYLDAWNDEKNTLTGGDNIPDKYQAVVTYKVVGGTWKDGKTDDQVQVFTLKTKNKETGVWEDVTPAPTLGNTIPTGMISSYSRTASQSWDKDITKDTKVTESMTYTYTFTKGSSGGGSSGGGGGRKPTVDIPDDVPTGLNGDDHFAYIVGYPDGNVKPGGNITRAEVATIFFRLLTEDVRTANSTQANSLSDVSRGQWFNHAISTLSSMGIVKGNPDGTFDPDAPITRAEFAAIAARFDDKNTNNTSNFSDIASHWAKDEIGVAANKGWINGYPDGTVRPNQYITRAEAMTLVNRVLNRLPEKSEDLLDDMIKWPDNADASVWYYLAVQEATNSHDYSDKSDADKYEKWTKLRENRDWTELEK